MTLYQNQFQHFLVMQIAKAAMFFYGVFCYGFLEHDVGEVLLRGIFETRLFSVLKVGCRRLGEF
jgi:hypothetical protein